MDEEDIILGICPVCSEFISSVDSLLGSSLEEIMSRLSDSLFCNEENSERTNINQGNLTELELNPITGVYEPEEQETTVFVS